MVGVWVWVGLRVGVGVGVFVATSVLVALAVLVGGGSVGVKARVEVEVAGKVVVVAAPGASPDFAVHEPRQNAPKRSATTSNRKGRILFFLPRLVCIIPPLRHRCLDFDV